MENNAGGVQDEGGIGNDPGIVPALTAGIVHQEHVIGEDLAEAQLVLIGLFLEGRTFSDLDIQHIRNSPLLTKLKL